MSSLTLQDWNVALVPHFPFFFFFFISLPVGFSRLIFFFFLRSVFSCHMYPLFHQLIVTPAQLSGSLNFLLPNPQDIFLLRFLPFLSKRYFEGGSDLMRKSLCAIWKFSGALYLIWVRKNPPIEQPKNLLSDLSRLLTCWRAFWELWTAQHPLLVPAFGGFHLPLPLPLQTVCVAQGEKKKINCLS